MTMSKTDYEKIQDLKFYAEYRSQRFRRARYYLMKEGERVIHEGEKVFVEFPDNGKSKKPAEVSKESGAWYALRDLLAKAVELSQKPKAKPAKVENSETKPKRKRTPKP